MAATVSSVSSIAVQGDGTLDLTITKPTGTAEGDLLIAVVGQNTTGGTWGLPAGWTSWLSGGATGNISDLVAYKVAGASEGTDYTFSKDTLAAAEKIGRIFRVTGYNTSTWQDFTPTASYEGTGTTSATAPDETTTEANVLLIRAVIVDRNRMATSTPPSGLTDESHADSAGVATNSVGHGSGWQLQASSGATGTKIWTLGTADQWVGYTIGVRSAASGATATPLYYYRMMNQ